MAAASCSEQLVATSLITSCLSPVGAYHSSMNAGAESQAVNVLCLGSLYALHLILIAVLLMVVCVFGSSQEFAAIILRACSMLT